MDASMGDGTVEGNKGVESYIERYREAGMLMVACKLCNKTAIAKNVTTIRKHILRNHMQFCNVCGKQLKRKNAVCDHIVNDAFQ